MSGLALLLRRYWPQIAVGVSFVLMWVAIGWLVHQRNSARDERDDLLTWQGGVITAISIATVPPDKGGAHPMLKPIAVVPAIDALAADRDDARRALAAIDKATREAKGRADAEDADLTRVQAGNAARLSAAMTQIDRLKALRGTGDAAKDCSILDEISGVAWRAWR